MSDDKKHPAYDAFSVEKPEHGDKDAKPYYRNIGAAWPTKANNGALNLRLKVLPVDGNILLLPWKPKESKSNGPPSDGN